MAPPPAVQVVRELTSRGYNADREAVTLLSRAADPADAVSRVLDSAPEDALTLSAAHVRAAIDTTPTRPRSNDASTNGEPTNDAPQPTVDADGAAVDGTAESTALPEAIGSDADADSDPDPGLDPSVSTGNAGASDTRRTNSPVETEGFRSRDASKRSLEIANDMTGRSTGTGEYADFVRVFRDRYERFEASRDRNPSVSTGEFVRRVSDAPVSPVETEGSRPGSGSLSASASDPIAAGRAVDSAVPSTAAPSAATVG